MEVRACAGKLPILGKEMNKSNGDHSRNGEKG